MLQGASLARGRMIWQLALCAQGRMSHWGCGEPGWNASL